MSKLNNENKYKKKKQANILPVPMPVPVPVPPKAKRLIKATLTLKNPEAADVLIKFFFKKLN